MYKITYLALFIFVSAFIYSKSIYAKSWPNINFLSTSKQPLPDTVKITIAEDQVYKKQKTYLAYPLDKIIKRLELNSNSPLTDIVIVFTAADGYKVTMAYQDALLEKGYIAYQDLSSKNALWTSFKFGNEMITPAPYYLVWPKPDLDKWRYPSPFQLISISLQSSDTYFSAAAPLSDTANIKQGFALFSRYCIRCHSVNHTGGKLGPELNVPKNITDFYSKKKLTDFILDAPSFRTKTKMPVFKTILSQTEALKIQHYLESMKK